MTLHAVGTPPTTYQPGQLVVALEHRDHIIDVLTEVQARPSVLDHSAELGLALLSIKGGVERATGLLVADLAHGPPAPGAPQPVVRAPAFTGDLGPLLAALRAWFGRRHAGWFPTMGKNRLAGSVVGGDGVVGHGGAGMPTPLPGPLPRRRGGPGNGVVVGVLDTGVAVHPWLAGNWLAGADDMLTSPPPHQPAEGHATFVAGLVLAQAPSATVKVRQVLRRPAVADCWSVAKAIVEFGCSGLDVLNLSLVCFTEDGAPPLALCRAIERLPAEVVVVAAAGNHGGRDDGAVRPAYPGAMDRVVAVGAVDADGSVAAYTPRDAEWIDVLARGTDVPSTYLSGPVCQGTEQREFAGWASWTGTSFAAALVSGAIAALTRPGHVSAPEAYQLLRSATVPARPHGTDPVHGRLLRLADPYATAV
jgi:membrane-anchored mycosin MYCP